MLPSAIMGFQRIGAGLRGLVARWVDDPELERSLVQQAWEEAAGDAIARRTRLQGYEDGVLRVRVTDPAWEDSIRDMRGRLLERLEAALGDRAPKRIEWVQED